MTLNGFDLSLLGPPLLAGLLVLATHVPMGRQVLARGIIFIDLAIAQIAGLGVITANAFGWQLQGWEVQVGAVGAALTGALLLTWTERRMPQVQEALIGVLFILAATGGLLLLAGNPHGGEHLKNLLIGQILWVSYTQLLPTGLLTLVILGLWFGLAQQLGRSGFYLLFACAVTLSVQLVGVYLVFASLIIPALACYNIPARWQVSTAYTLGMLGYLTGLLASALFDLPSGAVIVWAMASLGLIFFICQYTLAGIPDSEDQPSG